MTTSRKQTAAVSAAGLIVVGLWYWTTALPSPDVEFSDFVRVAPRPFRARVPGGLPYRPATDASRTAPDSTPVDLPAEVRLAAARVELAADVSAEARVRAATARLLLGDTAGALSRTDVADPDSLRADASVLRSAAHLARYEQTGDPIDAAFGLDWALRALDRDSEFEEARHNVGLALSYLGPRHLAFQSWSAAGAAARSEDWRREAEATARALSGETDRRTRLSQFVESWEGSRTFSAHQVRTAPDMVREVFERVVVPSWMRSFLGGQTTESPTDAVRAVARALVDRTGDRQPLDTVDTIVRGCGAGLVSCQRIASLYRHYVDGRVAWDANRYGEAYAHFDRVVAEPAILGLPESGWANIHLGLRDYYAGRFAAARRRAAKALGQARGRGYVATAGRAAWLLGLISHEEGNLGQAASRYAEALQDFTRSGEREHRGAVRSLLADYYRLVGDLPHAWTHIADSLATTGVAGPLRRSMAYSNAAAVAEDGGLTWAANYFLREATTEAEHTGNAVLVAQALTDEAMGLANNHRTADARYALHRARAVLSSATATDEAAIVAAGIDVAEAGLAAESHPADAARHLSDALHFWERHGTGLNLPALLLSRGRAFVRQGLVSAAVADWTKGADLARRQLTGVASREERSALRAARWALHAELADAEARRNGNRERAVEVLDDGRSPKVHAGGGWAAPGFRVARDQWMVPRDTVILVYETYPTRTLAWVWTQHALVSFVVPLSERELDAVLTGHAQAITANNRAAARQSGSALFAALTGPAADSVRRARRVVVVAGRRLTALPFATLFDEKHGRFLVEWASSEIAPSVASWLDGIRHGDRRRGRVGRALVVGNPRTAPAARLGRLLSAQREAEVTSTFYPSATVLLGTAATRGRFLDALRSASVVHFAGHAVQNPQRPHLSWLALTPGEGSPDGAVLATDIDGLNLAACQLVVLAACDTARGTQRGGEGVVGLVSAFLEAGAKAVVATLWPIDDAASRPLFETLHAEWQRSQDAPEALRSAQLNLMGRDAGRAAISVWAAPVVVGRGRAAVRPKGVQ